MLPNIEIINALSEAYSPCQFFGKCKEAKWIPEEGHIPRGFLGATGSVDEVEAIFVFAEPGHPMVDKNDNVLEPYPDSLDPEGYMELTTDFAFKCFDREVDAMHSNVKYILNQVWPSLQFAEQLRKVWMTETRLCSIDDEIGNISIGNRDICSWNYLRKQLNLFPEATVVGFGGKAQQTLRRLNVKHLKAWSVSPPGANNSKARDSWDEVIEVLKKKGYMASEEKEVRKKLEPSNRMTVESEEQWEEESERLATLLFKKLYPKQAKELKPAPEQKKIKLDSVARARKIAEKVHADLEDKKNVPYIAHILDVASRVSHLGKPFEIVALLHDTIEDAKPEKFRTEIFTEINDNFSEEIIRAVLAMTKSPGEDYFEDYLPRLKKSEIAVQVKIADASHNLSKAYLIEEDKKQEELRSKYISVLNELGVDGKSSEKPIIYKDGSWVEK